MNKQCRFKLPSLLLVLLSLGACTTINVDHVQLEDNIQIVAGESIVVLGRKNTAEIETESSLVSCIGGRLQRKIKGVDVIPQQQFIDSFYPWFEARTAPQHPNKLRDVLVQPLLAERMEELGIRYFVWVEGSTERTGSSGTMTCSIAPGGGGCFGFGTWEDTSDYETTIWDAHTFKEVGRISTEAVGQSYMPAFVVPIPMLARVEGNACEGMGNQLANFFNQESEIKRLP